jgi:hypothetical protein
VGCLRLDPSPKPETRLSFMLELIHSLKLYKKLSAASRGFVRKLAVQLW